MIIQIDNKEGAIGIRVRDFQDRRGNYQKGYKQYHYCDKEVKEEMANVLAEALSRIKFGARK